VTITALIVAAGRGTRMSGDIPKQFRILAGKSVLSRAIQPFIDHDQIDRVLVVIHQETEDRFETIRDTIIDPKKKLLPPVYGGANRADSTLNGLLSLRETSANHTLIHDAARPFVTGAVISRVIDALDTEYGAIPTLPAIDAMRRSDESGALGEPIARDGIRRAQTPQGFRFDTLLPIMQAAPNDCWPIRIFELAKAMTSMPLAKAIM